jgi:DNA-binding HxlR family transcriptional regulator
MLTQQLRHLQRFGIVDRRQYEQIPPRVEYSLTGLGKTLFPLLDQVSRWSRTNMPRIRQAAAAFDDSRAVGTGRRV